ncbi:MAG: rod shape-determining protein MreD [Coriobacteriia bacterium]|nr:rod shape-determining protein MreD [Coriobacteriia bacterium]MDO9107919.1 rod shape-determining protein MreD [Coriobacteriia bacterium]
MRRALPTIVALFAAALLQVAVAPNLAIGGAVPNFMLLVVVTLALTQGASAGAAAGFVAGLVFDLLGAGPIGPGALVFTVVGHLAGSLSANMFAEGWRLPTTVVLIASLLTELSYGAVLAVLGQGEPFWSTFVAVMLPTAVYNGVLALLVFPFLARLLRQDRQMTTFRRLG